MSEKLFRKSNGSSHREELASFSWQTASACARCIIKRGEEAVRPRGFGSPIPSTGQDERAFLPNSMDNRNKAGLLFRSRSSIRRFNLYDNVEAFSARRLGVIEGSRRSFFLSLKVFADSLFIVARRKS